MRPNCYVRWLRFIFKRGLITGLGQYTLPKIGIFVKKKGQKYVNQGCNKIRKVESKKSCNLFITPGAGFIPIITSNVMY